MATLTGNIKGPKGDPGPAGPEGPAGADGTNAGVALTIGDGVNSTFTVANPHGPDVLVECVNLTTGQTCWPVIQRIDADSIYLDFGDTVPAVASRRVLISLTGGIGPEGPQGPMGDITPEAEAAADAAAASAAEAAESAYRAAQAVPGTLLTEDPAHPGLYLMSVDDGIPDQPDNEAFTYNPDGTIATETTDGVVTAYTYNSDGTIHSDTTNGETRIYSYDGSGNLTGIVSA